MCISQNKGMLKNTFFTLVGYILEHHPFWEILMHLFSDPMCVIYTWAKLLDAQAISSYGTCPSWTDQDPCCCSKPWDDEEECEERFPETTSVLWQNWGTYPSKCKHLCFNLFCIQGWYEGNCKLLTHIHIFLEIPAQVVHSYWLKLYGRTHVRYEMENPVPFHTWPSVLNRAKTLNHWH